MLIGNPLSGVRMRTVLDSHAYDSDSDSEDDDSDVDTNYNEPDGDYASLKAVNCNELTNGFLLSISSVSLVYPSVSPSSLWPTQLEKHQPCCRQGRLSKIADRRSDFDDGNDDAILRDMNRTLLPTVLLSLLNVQFLHSKVRLEYKSSILSLTMSWTLVEMRMVLRFWRAFMMCWVKCLLKYQHMKRSSCKSI